MSLTKIKVRYAETDAMGVVHHANYYIYFEAAREDLIKEKGLEYKDLEEMGIMMPLIETQCRYKNAAKYADNLIVECEIEELKDIKLTIGYTIKREEDSALVAKGRTVQTFVDKETFKIVNLRKVRPDIWEKYFSN